MPVRESRPRGLWQARRHNPDRLHGQQLPGTRPSRRSPCSRTPRTCHRPAPKAETEEQAGERREQFEAQQKAHQQEEDRRAQERRQQQEREEGEREAEFEKRDQLRKKREKTFEQIVANAPATLTAAQLRVILRAIVNLDPYTFADDLATDISEDPDNDRRSAEEVLLTVIDGTADDKLTSFAVRLAFAGHRGIPRENEPDFLTEAAAVFLIPKQKKNPAAKKEAPARKEPTPIKAAKTAVKKGKAAKEEEPPQPQSQPSPG